MKNSGKERKKQEEKQQRMRKQKKSFADDFDCLANSHHNTFASISWIFIHDLQTLFRSVSGGFRVFFFFFFFILFFLFFFVFLFVMQFDICFSFALSFISIFYFTKLNAVVRMFFNGNGSFVVETSITQQMPEDKLMSAW